MLEAPIPANEPERIEALKSLEILDTLAGERLDRITRLVSRTFQVPICLVSLVDSDRQWFASKVGLEAAETPRDISFCGHAIHQTDIFMIPDATKDERFADNPLVTCAPDIRFYAGCPLNIRGYNVGTLCLIDTRPRVLDEGQKELFKHFAKMTEDELQRTYEDNIDDVTGMSNLKGFTILTNSRIQQCLGEHKKVEFIFVRANKLNQLTGSAKQDAQTLIADALKKSFRNSEAFAQLSEDTSLAMLVDSQQGMFSKQADDFAHALDEGGTSLFNNLGITLERRTCEARTLQELEASLRV